MDDMFDWVKETINDVKDTILEQTPDIHINAGLDNNTHCHLDVNVECNKKK